MVEGEPEVSVVVYAGEASVLLVQDEIFCLGDEVRAGFTEDFSSELVSTSPLSYSSS